jgi:hypothetical protein
LAHEPGSTIKLPEVDDDIGHTFVHYLYHDEYQTLKPPGATGPPDSETEYKRGILAYCTARSYEIHGLAGHALKTIERFGKELTIAQILDAVHAVYAKLPQDEVWLPTYLKAQLETAFELDENVFTRQEFLKHIGEDVTFTKALVKIMANMISNISAKPPHQPQELDQHTVEQVETHPEEAPEDCSASEDFENIHTPRSFPSDDEGTTDEDRPPLAALAGLVCEHDGSIKDYTGKVIGKVIEGDSVDFAAKMYFCNGIGNVCDYKNKPVGKCETISADKPRTTEKAKNDDLWGSAAISGVSVELVPPEPSAVPEPKLELKVKPGLEPEVKPMCLALSSLHGRAIEKNGDILDDDGQVIGRLVKGVDMLKMLFRNMAQCNATGKVLVGSKVVPRARVAFVIPEKPAATGSRDLVPLERMDNSARNPEQPTFASIEGKLLDEFGNIYNDENILVARLVKGIAGTLNKKWAYCDADGSVIVKGKRQSTAKMELVFSNKKEDDLPLPIPEPEPVLKPGVCPEQVRHLRDGGGWKTCEICRTLIHQMSIELLHEGPVIEEGAPAVTWADL